MGGNPLKGTDPLGLTTVVIIGGPSANNPFGHSAGELGDRFIYLHGKRGPEKGDRFIFSLFEIAVRQVCAARLGLRGHAVNRSM